MATNSDYEFYSSDLDKIIGIVNHYPCVMDDVVSLTTLMRHIMDFKGCTGSDAVEYIVQSVAKTLYASYVQQV